VTPLQREITVGERIPELEFEVLAEPMKVFSVLMRDPNPIHFDPEFVRSLGLGDQPVNQGTITMGYLLNAVLAWIGDAERLRVFRCRFHGSVVAGQRVRACGAVEAISGEGDMREVDLTVWLEQSGGERLLTGSARVHV
jgi:acyl dehydratase